MANEPIERQDDLKALRRKNRLRQEQLRAEFLAEAESKAAAMTKARRVRETWQTAWVDPWLTAMTNNSSNAFAPFGPATIWQRKKGQNYPVYRTETDLALLRFPARWLCATNSYAIGFVGGLTGYMLGNGLTYRVVPKDENDTSNADLIAALQEVVDDTLEANEWFGGELPGFEEEFFQRSVEDGEAIATHWVTADGVQFRFADPEQLTEPAKLAAMAERPYEFGVRVDVRDVERPLEYVIAYDDAKTEYDILDAERVTHLRRNAKRSMKRGVPDISFQTYEALDQAAKLMENSGESAAQQAAIVAVMSFKVGTQSEIQAVASAGNDYYEFDPYSGQQIGVKKTRKGTTEYVPDSQQYVSGPAASNAAAHMQIQMELLRCAGVRWNAPDWLITGNASGNTFSNAGQVASSFCNTIIRQQRRYTAAFRRMIWYAVQKAVEAGGVTGRSWDDVVKVCDLSVEAPNPIMPDPLADAQVAAIEIPMGVQSRQAYAQEKGRDWDKIEADNAAWEQEHQDELVSAKAQLFGAEAESLRAKVKQQGAAGDGE
jgi:hypothetical protein